jgi:hypothetical protein
MFSRLGTYPKRVLNISHLDGTTVNIPISYRLDSPLTSHTIRATRALRLLHVKEAAGASYNGQHVNIVPEVNLLSFVTDFALYRYI